MPLINFQWERVFKRAGASDYSVWAEDSDTGEIVEIKIEAELYERLMLKRKPDALVH